MKKRILFVDDEPMVLQGIERLLRPMRHEWGVDIAEGGETAKALVARTAYDVVVTDMKMPGINGAELLEWVREHSPKSIRFVLSGYAEQNLTMKCVGVAHQFLGKPCDAEMLKSVILRATSGTAAVHSEQAMALVAGITHLPSIPAIYSRIVEMLNDPNASIKEVGALVASDTALAAKVLQIVNSSFFGLKRRVSEPAEAASFLGLETLKALILAASVFNQFAAAMPRNFSPSAIAEYSRRIGEAARLIAEAEHAGRAVADEAMLAGLLHEVGKLVLASNLPEKFQRAAEMKDRSSVDAEREVFGTTHAQVGGYLLGLWGLPPAVIEAIRFHHSPSESSSGEFSALAAVHVADRLQEELLAADSGIPCAGVDLAYLTRLGLAHRLPAWRAIVRETLRPSASNNRSDRIHECENPLR